MNAYQPDMGTDLGAQLRRKREAAGIRSQQEMADRLHCDRTLVNKIEGGKVTPTDDMVKEMAKLCGLDPEPYLIMAMHARRPMASLRWFESWLEIEGEARLIRVWCPLLVPGPLQTAEYAQALFTSTGKDEDTVARYTDIRLARRKMFASARVIVLIDEAVLYRMIGSPSIMADQLQSILDMSADLRLSVQVVPSARTACGMSGAFDIASGDSIPDTVRMDAVKDQVSDEHELVSETIELFDLLRGYALSRDQSRDTMTEALAEWRARAKADCSAQAATAATAEETASR